MSCGSCGSCGGCKAIKAVCALVTTVLAIAALIGVYKTHMTVDGWEFGTLNGSAAIIALVLSLKSWLCLVKSLCPCSTACAPGMCK